MAEKNTQGVCPYCGGGALTDEATQPDPRRKIQKCDACNKFSVYQRGVQYPLADPDDKSSSVVVRTP